MIVLEARLIEYGMKIYDTLTKDFKLSRGEEIKDWLHSHGNTRTIMYADNKEYQKLADQFIIIDDETHDIYNYYDESYVVKTNYNRGLTYFKAEEAIKKIEFQLDN